MKTIIPIVGILLVLIPAVPAFASNSDDASNSNVPCDPAQGGNPFQEKCGETQTHETPRGNMVCPPTPYGCINVGD